MRDMGIGTVGLEIRRMQSRYGGEEYIIREEERIPVLSLKIGKVWDIDGMLSEMARSGEGTDE